MNEIPTIILKAQRIQTEVHKGELIVFAYKPVRGVMGQFREQERNKGTFRMDLHDETGEWTTGAKWKIVEFKEGQHDDAMNLICVKA